MNSSVPSVPDAMTVLRAEGPAPVQGFDALLAGPVMAWG